MQEALFRELAERAVIDQEPPTVFEQSLGEKMGSKDARIMNRVHWHIV